MTQFIFINPVFVFIYIIGIAISVICDINDDRVIDGRAKHRYDRITLKIEKMKLKDNIEFWVTIIVILLWVVFRPIISIFTFSWGLCLFIYDILTSGIYKKE